MPGCGVEECQPPVSIRATFVDEQVIDGFSEHRFHRVPAQALDPHLNIPIKRHRTISCRPSSTSWQRDAQGEPRFATAGGDGFEKGDDPKPESVFALDK
ncbi:hypothetical protein NJB14197_08040 [Mycobacterium montefiorense]|nr:hypothetical protein NJB14195_47990 [Mycobacterium montefiorense]GKU54934.1 hypothetical protein NJB14197_08040 [Mycobacterium montefiorense]